MTKKQITALLRKKAFRQKLNALLKSYNSGHHKKEDITEWCEEVALWTEKLCRSKFHGKQFLELINNTISKLVPEQPAREKYDHLISLLVKGYEKIGAVSAAKKIRKKLHDPIALIEPQSLWRNDDDPFLDSIFTNLEAARSRLVNKMLTAGISEKESSDFYTCKPADNETDWSRTYFDFASAFLRRYNIVWTWLGINYFAFGKKDTDILAIVPYDLQAKIKDIITDQKQDSPWVR
jgi:hypothetical protein